MSIAPYEIEHEKFINLNIKLGLLFISLRFFVRLILGLFFKPIILPERPDISPKVSPLSIYDLKVSF